MRSRKLQDRVHQASFCSYLFFIIVVLADKANKVVSEISASDSRCYGSGGCYDYEILKLF